MKENGLAGHHSKTSDLQTTDGLRRAASQETATPPTSLQQQTTTATSIKEQGYGFSMKKKVALNHNFCWAVGSANSIKTGTCFPNLKTIHESKSNELPGLIDRVIVQ